MEPEAVERLSGELAETHRQFDDAAEEDRRHFDVVAEGLRSDVRLVADGIAAMRAELKTEIQLFREEVSAGFTELRSMLGRLAGISEREEAP